MHICLAVGCSGCSSSLAAWPAAVALSPNLNICSAYPIVHRKATPTSFLSLLSLPTHLNVCSIIGITWASPFLSIFLEEIQNLPLLVRPSIHSFSLLLHPACSVLHTRSFFQSSHVLWIVTVNRQNSLTTIEISPDSRPHRSHKVSSRLARLLTPACHSLKRASFASDNHPRATDNHFDRVLVSAHVLVLPHSSIHRSLTDHKSPAALFSLPALEKHLLKPIVFLLRLISGDSSFPGPYLTQRQGKTPNQPTRNIRGA